MSANTPSPLEKIFSARGKIVTAINAAFSPADWQNAGMIFVGAENISLEKSVFENISAPLAASGIPWENARQRIEYELNFWFEKNSADTFAAQPAGELSSENRLRLTLARACVTDFSGAPLVISQNLILPENLFEKLRERSRNENLAVVLENANGGASSRTETFAVFGESAPNVFRGKLLGTGAGEFFAEISSGTQIHGKLCGNVPEDLPAGTEIEIFLPPEIFHTDAFPPEENFFELAETDEGSEIFFDGHLYYRQFKTGDGYCILRVAAQHRQALEIPCGDALYAWFFPEDALGYVVAQG